MSSAPGVSGGPEDGWAAIRKAARHPQGLGGWVAGFVLSLLETVLPQVTFLDGSPVGTECPLQDNHVRGRLDALGTGRGVPQVLVT